MSIIEQATHELRELEIELRAGDHRERCDPAWLADRLRRVVDLLGGDDARWVGVSEARRILGFPSDNGVEAWVEIGFLRSRTDPRGQLQVSIDDVLERRDAREALSAIGGEELSPEELKVLREARPGKRPWERAA